MTIASALITVEQAPAWEGWKQAHARIAKEGSQRVLLGISFSGFSFLSSLWASTLLSLSQLRQTARIKMILMSEERYVRSLSDEAFLLINMYDNISFAILSSITNSYYISRPN